ncbi:MAG: DNA recombination protein RmuC, partial [Proteobacteria bacterium]|nr:DNA recombination protein RmuC [Pseudomonadota bacterium]
MAKAKAKTGNPFLDADLGNIMDFGKLAEQFKFPGVDTTVLIESQQRNIEAITKANQVAFAGVQAIMQRQAEILRKTVDEKLHATLEQRLGESFKLVSDRLDKVHQGLGEMQQLATGVGDLKRVLTNVKTRGTWGEVQLEILLEQMLTPDQYAKNVETVPASGERVEFAIRLPGAKEDAGQVW